MDADDLELAINMAKLGMTRFRREFPKSNSVYINEILPSVLANIVSEYCELADASDLRDLVKKNQRSLLRILIVSFIATNSDHLFKLAQSYPIWYLANQESDGVPGFQSFKVRPIHMSPTSEFIQFVANLLGYLGKYDWISEFIRENASIKCVIPYMAAGVGSVENLKNAIQMFPHHWWDYGALCDIAKSGSKNPDIIDFLTSSYNQDMNN